MYRESILPQETKRQRDHDISEYVDIDIANTRLSCGHVLVSKCFEMS